MCSSVTQSETVSQILSSILIVFLPPQLLAIMLTVPPPLGPKPRDILEQFYDNEENWKQTSTASSCDDFDNYPSWLHWSPSKKNQINDFFADIPPLPKVRKSRKAMIGALPVPDDEDSSDDDEGEEEEGAEDEDEDEEEEGAEEEDDEDPEAVEAEADGNIYEDEDDRAKDYDDDPMSGLSGPSLTSGSEYQPSR
jgi:hypothetical protein